MTVDRSTRTLLALVVTLAVTFAAAAIGARASIDAATFYQALDKPNFAPPGWLFGPVWTVLYLMMALAAFGVWQVRGRFDVKGALALYLVQLVFNALWSVLFFGRRLGAWSIVDIAVLWILIVATMLTFWRVRRAMGLLLVPYLLWVSFAAVLNVAVVRLNPTAFG